MSTLNEKSTLEELFAFITPEEGTQVLPVTMNNTPDGLAQMMIVIAGHPETSNVIMANLMTVVNDMNEQAQQRTALEDDESDGEPTIIVP